MKDIKLVSIPSAILLSISGWITNFERHEGRNGRSLLISMKNRYLFLTILFFCLITICNAEDYDMKHDNEIEDATKAATSSTVTSSSSTSSSDDIIFEFVRIMLGFLTSMCGTSLSFLFMKDLNLMRKYMKEGENIRAAIVSFEKVRGGSRKNYNHRYNNSNSNNNETNDTSNMMHHTFILELNTNNVSDISDDSDKVADADGKGYYVCKDDDEREEPEYIVCAEYEMHLPTADLVIDMENPGNKSQQSSQTQYIYDDLSSTQNNFKNPGNTYTAVRISKQFKIKSSEVIFVETSRYPMIELLVMPDKPKSGFPLEQARSGCSISRFSVAFIIVFLTFSISFLCTYGSSLFSDNQDTSSFESIKAGLIILFILICVEIIPFVFYDKFLTESLQSQYYYNGIYQSPRDETSLSSGSDPNLRNTRNQYLIPT